METQIKKRIQKSKSLPFQCNHVEGFGNTNKKKNTKSKRDGGGGQMKRETAAAEDLEKDKPSFLSKVVRNFS